MSPATSTVQPGSPDHDVESVESFRARARAWLAESMPRLAPGAGIADRDADRYAEERRLQRRIWDGGFAGVCWPAEYGGLGLGREHQRAFDEESLPYDMPLSFNIPTFGILAATLVDFGTHEQKARHLPAILRGEELWVQFLSEPSGGSDLAGCITRADRDGDVFIVNGSKIWSSAAADSDYAMCLARTNWDVPKHRGLTMFLMKIHQPGIQIDQIRQINGSMEFCQEFFDDVVVPVADVIGEIDDGWSVASRLLLHERTAVARRVAVHQRSLPGRDEHRPRSVVARTGRCHRHRDRSACAPPGRRQPRRARRQRAPRRSCHRRRQERAAPARSGFDDQALPCHGRRASERRPASTSAGSDAVVWPESDDGPGRRLGEASLSRQAMCLGGGSNEIQRNIISERILGLPREWAADREIPYRDVTRTSTPTGPGAPKDGAAR